MLNSIPNILILCPSPVIEVTADIVESTSSNSNQLADNVIIESGGKGVNVMRILHSIGIASVLVIPVGGSRGALLRANLQRFKNIEYVENKNDSRISIVINDLNESSNFIIRGPLIEEGNNWNDYIIHVKNNIRKKMLVAICGSVPKSFLKEALPHLQKVFVEYEVRLFIDSPNIKLDWLVKLNPYLIKPNFNEALQVMNYNTSSWRDLFSNSCKRISGNLFITNSQDGALVRYAGTICRVMAYPKLAKYPTGAGDALMAGLLFAELTNMDTQERLKLAYSICFASLFEISSGNIDIGGWKDGIYNNVHIKPLEYE